MSPFNYETLPTPVLQAEQRRVQIQIAELLHQHEAIVLALVEKRRQDEAGVY